MKNQYLIAFLIITAIGFIAYSNTFDAPFHFDSLESIRDNELIRDLGNLKDIFQKYKTRPIGYASFAVNYALGGLNLFGLHFVNILIHIINAFLVFILTGLILKTPKANLPPAQAKWVALFAALVFAVHPIQTQAVTYIVQRLTALAALFYLLSLIGYLKYCLMAMQEEPDRKRRQYQWLAFSLIAALFGMFTKEITFTIPFAVILLDIALFRSSLREVKASFKRLLPFLCLIPVIPCLYLSGSFVQSTDQVIPGSHTLISHKEYIYTQFNVIRTYIRLLFVPVNQNLDYNYPLYQYFFNMPTVLSFLLILALITLGAFLFKRGERVSGFCILFFFLALSVESSLIPIEDVIFEHRLYLPMAGFSMVVSYAFFRYGPRLFKASGEDPYPVPFKVVLGGLILVLAVLTYNRNQVWKSDLALWQDIVNKSPGNYRAHNNLGNAYKRDNRIDLAVIEYRKALNTFPEYTNALNNLANAYEKKGIMDSALIYYEKALKLTSGSARHADKHRIVLTNMAGIYSNLGMADSAISYNQAVVKIAPDDYTAHYNLAINYERKRLFNEAIRQYQKCLRINPAFISAHYNLGNLYNRMDRKESAIQAYQAVLKTDSLHLKARNNLALIFFSKGMTAHAEAELNKILSIDPGFAMAHYNLGNIYFERGDLAKAIEKYSRTIAILPRYVWAHYDLGRAYEKKGMREKAALEYQAALKLNPQLKEARKRLARIGK
jgi:tetratricopeptide (TPR) repeat protein